MDQLADGILLLPASEVLLTLEVEFPIPASLLGRLLQEPLAALAAGFKMAL